jgi:hypothetical protein
MMIQPNDESLKLMAEDLGQGSTCYYNINTGEVLSIPDIDPGEFEKAAGEKSDIPEMLDKIDAAPDDYIKIEPPHSSDAFGFMEDFIETIRDGKTRNRFALSIQKKGPFQQFRNCLLDYPEVRQKWFIYKGEREMAYVVNFIADNTPE